ncbi:hypothetical protein PILCRDRAFT_89247 [Piloderma croceum F 1598]|uniref:Phospholipid/glycerol acyltransferase domain-containing protein n=1 Tax=Piloderma croceum (strain F 1598) TaxID=765440 RepID=A0A0C3FQ20_PILCF|nr:hypothetical protein PILCRDRAFT_89247 [Piloderma croceum F 1598]
MMDPTLVYRTLRQLSQWTISGFYSDVHIEGANNVPKDGPLILASTHHNEIIDIAVLAITIPHRRPISFWTKSSLFEFPLAGAILSSSGAIPVTRNHSPTSLFKSTSLALHRGEAIGVFPEGTSYTQPRIMQVKPGAVRAGVEFGKGVVVVPVAIVYTDKSRYRSRVLVRYGSPIHILPNQTQDAEIDQAQVKNLTLQLESQLVSMSVNAPDWDTLNAAKSARDILWDDSDAQGEVPLCDWVEVMQMFTFAFPFPCASLRFGTYTQTTTQILIITNNSTDS